MNMKPMAWVLMLLCLFSTAFGAMPGRMASGRKGAEQEEEESSEIAVSADRLEFDAERNLLIGAGNVLVEQGDNQLQADFVTVHTVTEDMYAAGNVFFQSPGRTWRGDELRYNFKEQYGDFGQFEAYLDPMYIRAEHSHRASPTVYEMNEVFISSCEGERPSFFIKAKRATIEEDRLLRARHALVYVGGLPVFYLPFFRYDMERASNWSFVPGYNNRWGAFLLSTYRTRLNELVRSETQIDMRSERGLAGGQRFLWERPDMEGRFRSYYARDTSRYQGKDRLSEEQRDLIDENRYRLTLQHRQELTPQDNLLLNLDYVSDPFILYDFFRREYQEQVQPENYVAWNRVEDRFSYGLLLNKRLNDFYGNVNRLPEATLDIRRQEVLHSGFFYRGENAAAFLEREFPKLADTESYSAFRADTRHRIYYPMRLAGFLNITPHVGYRGTYYDRTREIETITNLVAVVRVEEDEEGEEVTFTSFTNDIQTIVRDGPSAWRNLPELGIEASFQAFRVFDPGGPAEGGLRHVAEPYTRYTLIPEPNVLPGELYQFDSVDGLDKRHVVRLGMRNQFQTKRRGRVRNLFDLDIYTDYNLDPDKDRGQEHLGSFIFDGRARPRDELSIRFDGAYDPHESEITHFNARANYEERHLGRLGTEYRYRKDRTDQITAYLDLFPNERWFGGAYWRYQFLDSELEEHTYYIGRQDHCLGYRLGYTGDMNEEWNVWFELWLTAFPSSQLRTAIDLDVGGRRN